MAPRPSRLFDTPEPIKVVAIVPDGPPSWMAWRGQAHTVRSSLSPERIGLPWWDHHDAAGTRDYYEVQDELGRWLWVFRERRTSSRSAACRWFVHGEWA
jgi:protein ImuB